MTGPSDDPLPETARDPSGAGPASPPLEPGLYVVSTPIGNLRDITMRALDVLKGADAVYAEDTRVTKKLLDAFGIGRKLQSYHEHNAEAAREDILTSLTAGRRIALVSDAGTPLISDPGYKLARAVIEAGYRIFPIPGASALLAALVTAGLPTDRFLFAGFTPAKSSARRTAFEELADTPATLVFYETGPRLVDSIADMALVFGPREAAVARELTKLFEETRRAPLDQLLAHYQNAGPPKGEIVVLIAPPPEKGEADDTTLDALLREALKRASVKEAATEAAQTLRVPRRRAYARALELKAEKP